MTAKLIALALVLLILAAIGYGEIVAWRECLKDHSGFYCYRVLQ